MVLDFLSVHWPIRTLLKLIPAFSIVKQPINSREKTKRNASLKNKPISRTASNIRVSANLVGGMSPEVEPHLPPIGFSSAGEDLTLSRGDLDSNREPGRTGAESQSSGFDGKTSFLKLLIEAEAAASSAAIQLVSFRHAEDGLVDPSTKDKLRMARQRGLLLEKLEDFRQINKSLRRKLRRLQGSEADRIDAERQMESLMKKMAEAESENERLKKDLNEMEKRVEDLICLRREQQEETRGADQTTKSADAAHARMQGQLRSKEAENRRLTSQLQTLERTVVEQKMVIKDLRASMNILNVKASEDRESLRKATRAQKRRAERFEAAVEKCYAQLKEKEAQLAEARTERDSRRQQKEQMTNGKDRLLAHIDVLKSEIADLTLRLQKARNNQNAADETVKRKADKVIADNNDLLASNAALKTSVTRLQQQLADCESALVEEKILSQEKKLEVERCQFQAAELQAELDRLRLTNADLLRETQKTKNGKQAEVEKMESQAKQLRSSAEMTESVLHTNTQLQEKGQALQKQMDRLQQENLELVRKLAYQEEALSYSKGQLDQRASECQALNRQLEAALSDVRQQVNKVKSQAASREDALQTKILDLEAEKNKRDNELKLLRQSKLTSDRRFEVRLKDLQLSLDQSESHKRSIQSYVDFLKNSYKSMFDEGLHATTFRSLQVLD
ncbi:hypothetical protein OJAV_G00176470 [Oryzias javanicus]|uniref:Outer dense fiber protein 2-like n=1 Tax=Oryzias javanicus TaxID=123683 RepID=A0A437CGB3_ORYJA|nr:hypothetical protein OJAV_G00176470 [Oryzias javanicus]